MHLPKDHTLIQKEIRHARIKVSEDGHVRILVPNSFTAVDIESLLAKKSEWIEKQRSFFAKKSRIELSRNQLLLLGNRYSYFYDPTYKRKIVVDHDFKTIRAKRNLLNLAIQERWYNLIARKQLVKRTEELAERLKFKYNKIYIRGQRTKLGNCSEEKNISLNWRLMKAPAIVIDYIIMHELVHTKVMNHTIKFWTLLKSLYPDYKDAIRWLDKYGNSL